MSDDFKAWRENVAKALIEERDAAVARYLREHLRAAFMDDTLQKVYDAIPDINGGRGFNRERLHEALTKVQNAIGHWVNSSGGDDDWYEQNFDFNEWERDYFGPRPPAIRATGEQPGNAVKVDAKLDPEPWNVSYNGVVTNRTSIYKPRFENSFGETVTRIFAPRGGYSQNPADYSIPSDPEQKAGKRTCQS